MIERTVEFDGKNSWLDYRVVFETFSITPPEPNLVLIDIPYRSGSLDETDYFGDITYKDRKLSMTFIIPDETLDLHGLYSNILNELHGRRKKIILSADENWYYEGRLSVGDLSRQSEWWGFPIEAKCDPYKYRDVRVIYNIREDGQQINVYNNGTMKTIPDITSQGDLVLSFEDKSWNLQGEATYAPTDFILKPGNNLIKFEQIVPDTKIRFIFKEGRL